MVFDKEGNLCKKLPMFKEAMDVVVLNDDGTTDCTGDSSIKAISRNKPNPVDFDPERNIPAIYEALVLGIKDYFKKMNFSINNFSFS